LSGPRKTTARFVLDASVSVRWALADGSATDIQYADQVLGAFKTSQGVVPNLWYTEMAHVIGGSVKRGLITHDQGVSALSRINSLLIAQDEANAQYSQANVVRLMHELSINGYDAQYLEIASRLNAPLATLDLELRKAANKAGVTIYLMSTN
jgi:predicted nucleic acid-binding protein